MHDLIYHIPESHPQSGGSHDFHLMDRLDLKLHYRREVYLYLSIYYKDIDPDYSNTHENAAANLYSIWMEKRVRNISTDFGKSGGTSTF